MKRLILTLAAAMLTACGGGDWEEALARKEISAADLDAAAKMVAAQAMHLKAEIDVHVKAQHLREKGADIGRLPALGHMVVGDGS